MVELRKQGVTIAMAPPPSPRLSEIPKATIPPLPAHAQLSHPTTAKPKFGFWEGLSTPATDTKASSAAGINNNVKILACPDDNVWTLVEDGYKGKEETIVPVMRGALSPQDVGNTRRKSRKSGMSEMVQIPPLAPLGTSVWSRIMSAQARVPQGSVENVSQVPVAGETDISKSVPIQSASTSARPLPPPRKRAPKLSHEKLRQRPRNSKGYVPPPPFSIPRSRPTAPQTSTQQQRNAAGKTETDGDQVQMRNTNAERGEGSVKVGGGQIEKEMGEIWPPLRRLGD
ncbi:hypothetical protein BDZ91DRAFT_742523 [Kalaharituber pfeilii]|nr:hypothetical protein BDZ91DRAFT_742523 [Kalaharituber pfeilii]